MMKQLSALLLVALANAQDDANDKYSKFLNDDVRQETSTSSESGSGEINAKTIEEWTKPLCGDGECISPFENSEEGMTTTTSFAGGMGSATPAGTSSSTTEVNRKPEETQVLCADGTLDCLRPPKPDEEESTERKVLCADGTLDCLKPPKPDGDHFLCEDGTLTCVLPPNVDDKYNDYKDGEGKINPLSPEDSGKKSLCADGTYGCNWVDYNQSSERKSASVWDSLFGESEDGAMATTSMSLIVVAAVALS